MMREIYPNSPLVKVVFELRFPGEPAIVCHRDRFYEEVRSEFPTIRVPHATSDLAPDLQPYHFQSADASDELTLSMNSAAYTTERYPGFENFKSSALLHLERVQRLFGVGSLRRTGLRYTNLCTFSRETGDTHLPIESFIKPSFFSISEPLESIDLQLKIPQSKGTLLVYLRSVVDPANELEALVIDFDYFKLHDDLMFDKVEEYLDESHSATKAFFEGTVAESYLRYVKGKEER